MRVTVAMLLFALAACVRSMAGTTGVMHGVVLDESGQPAADAVVTVASPSETDKTYTDKRGFFVFMALPPDVYTVGAAKSGTSNAFAMGVRINSDQTTLLNFRFTPYLRCPAFTRVTLAANQGGEQFWSLDVRQMAQYPPNIAPLVLQPMMLPAAPPMCL